MMSESYTKFDPIEYLTTEEQVESYLAVAKEANDPVIYEQAHEVAERAGKKLFSKNPEARVVFAELKE